MTESSVMAGSGMKPRKPPIKDFFKFGKWTISTIKSHILTSDELETISKQFELPHLPDMLFVNNRVTFSHENGAVMEFNPLEALKLVNSHEDLVRVSYSKDWLAARQESPHLNNILHPFDWTYTTNYKGTLNDAFNNEVTDELINYEKLKIQEKILFFDEVVLYEDELDDNGCTKLSVKLRVMPSGFFILQRFYLRVDKTLIRVYDTRIYHEVENNYLIREYSEREEQIDKLSVPREVWTDHNEIVNHLPVQLTKTEKLSF